MKAFKYLLFVFTLCLFSCDDILEEDISDNKVITSTPEEGDIIESNVVDFQWEELEGAKKYRLHILDENDIIIKDTLTDRLSLTLPLDAGDYKWKMRGENFAYQSKYTDLIHFQVIESDDLTKQKVILLSPSTDFYTNSKTFSVEWEELAAAETYTIRVVNVTNSNTIVLDQSGLTATTYAMNNSILGQDARYEWKIKAVNATSETLFSTRTFYVDTVVPNQPQNTLPANNAVNAVNQNVNFSWTMTADSGTIQSPIELYVIEIARDAAFTDIIQTSNTTTTTFQRSFNTAGDVYWRVKAKDKAGNFSPVSAAYKLTIN